MPKRLLLIGTLTGFVSGIFGVGGTFLAVPLLIRFMQLDRRQAQGTALTLVFSSALMGATADGVMGGLHFHIIFWLLSGSLVGARVGVFFMKRIPVHFLAKVFGLFLLFVALSLGLMHVGPPLWSMDILHLVLLGLLMGFLSGLLGVGGGGVLIPGLVILFGVAQRTAEGISLAVIVPTSAMGAYGYLRSRFVVISWLPLLLPATWFGSLLGVLSANLMPAIWLRYAFAALLLYLGLRALRAKK